MTSLVPEMIFLWCFLCDNEWISNQMFKLYALS
uniref:Uncharacterized protein n=1 Tax=Arundo donax TaxID=35708 RepID=A0A0A9GTN5_ARUDO